MNLYEQGVPGTDLAERYGVTRQRIDQILKARGAMDAVQARAVRSERRASERFEGVQAFLDEHDTSLRSLANSGATRTEVESKFALLTPETSADIVREAIRRSGVLFDVNREEYHFGQSVVEAGVWYILASANALRGDLPVALAELSLDEMTEVAQALARLGIGPERSKEVLVSVAAARRQLIAAPDLTISKKRYDEQRSVALIHLGLTGGHGSLVWPPTSQTVMKRLGSGYWKDALASIGITASGLGRSRGLIVFEESDYQSAMTDFLHHCAATESPESFDSFEAWVSNEDRLGRQRPSGAAVRNFYQSWTNAKRTALTGWSVQSARPSATSTAASAARTALHDASNAHRSALDQLSGLPARDRAAALVTFVKDHMGVFEARRRVWFRAIVKSDPGAITRRLAAPGLKPAQRLLLEATPPDLDAVLTDMYLDRLLGTTEGLRSTDGWLESDAQAELDSIPEVDLSAMRVMRELRNFFTHDSAESQSRLTTAMSELGELDDRFRTDRPLTRRFICRWLLSDDANRLAALSGSVLAAWRGMLAAEAVASG
ncbi:hypothetical protein [Knoellia sp. Soil729]|uniref:hypothetical protein n=1 Tax=Knoellia sp. Soil729 TaxID=1736394 RepID=UPI0012E7C4F3|nr:hypothetical protein [Knoellia sp. Soil729]